MAHSGQDALWIAPEHGCAVLIGDGMPGQGFGLDAHLAPVVHFPFHQIDTAINHISRIINLCDKDIIFITDVFVHREGSQGRQAGQVMKAGEP